MQLQFEFDLNNKFHIEVERIDDDGDIGIEKDMGLTMELNVYVEKLEDGF
ncbi:hypothetical protein QTL86_00110 [Cellulosilyticum sp. ST5]|nr:hypothetical protein [Cellulosilyticum sp. WCF-2]